MITVRYFGSLKETLGRSSDVLAITDTLSIAEVWHKINSGSLPENSLSALNMEYVSLTHLVQDGDEVAFFPPVTGG